MDEDGSLGNCSTVLHYIFSLSANMAYRLRYVIHVGPVKKRRRI